MKNRYVVSLCCVLLLSLTRPGTFSASAQDPIATQQQDVTPQVVTIQLSPVVTGLSSTVFVTNAHDGSNRLFIVEKGGVIRVLQPGSSTPTTFLNITPSVLSTANERGLLGLVFHPQYSTNGRFFVNYTRQTDGALQVAEYHVSASNPNVADTAETIILTTPHPTNDNHNGGMIEFGPDGFLYIGLGDGGSANDPPNNGQNINALLGKILRIDIDNPAGGLNYSSPASNPFFGPTAGRDEIYSYGHRNPWRYSFDRGNGQLILGDVGQGAREEIDIVTLGGNYGWRVMEGSICNPNLNGGACTPPTGSILPVSEYSHASGRCSITGGYVYRGVKSSLPTGAYVFADFCTGEIFMRQPGLNTSTVLLDTALGISSFGEDESGEIYVVGLGGTIDRIANPSPPPRNTIGVYRPSGPIFYLRNTNSAGAPDLAIPFGAAGDIPLAGDWDGDGTTTIGLYRPSDNVFYLRNTNLTGPPDLVIPWGAPGDIPVVGDWDGNGTVTIGLYRPGNNTFYLRNSNDFGPPNLQIPFGAPGDIPIVGDWDGNTTTTIGLYRPSGSIFYLRNSNTFGTPNVIVAFGAAGDLPIVGDWDGNGTMTIGVYRTSGSTFYLRNTNSTAAPDLLIQYGDGPNGDKPVSGNWDGF